MNKLSTCLIIILAIFYACKNGRKDQASFNADKPVIVAGRILNRSTYPNIKEIKLTIYDFKGNESVFTLELDSTGEFKFKIYPKTKREIKLFPVEDIIVVNPGDSLFIVKDFKDVCNTKFSGDRKNLNNLITKFRGSLLNSYSSADSLDPRKFKEYCNELKQKNYQKLEDFKKIESVTAEFNDWATRQIELEYYESLLDFPFQHYLITKEKPEGQDYYTFLDKLAQYMDNSLVMSKYYSIGMKLAFIQLKSYQEKNREELKAASMNEMLYDYLPLIKNSFSFSKSDFLNQWVLYSFVNTSLEANSTSLVDQYSKEINSKITDPFLKSSLDDQYNKVKAFLQNPRPLSASLLGTSGKETKVISLKSEDHENPLKAIIDKFPNKAVYLDFWATWCSPCIRNMQYSKELEKKYMGKDVEFVYVCMKSSQADWEKKVTELNLTGHHYLMTENESRITRKKIGYFGFPYYLLIDKKGTIVDYGNHLVPQNLEVKHKIEELIKE
jgi:thiol-disulfide isomerase/thioredoxin